MLSVTVLIPQQMSVQQLGNSQDLSIVSDERETASVGNSHVSCVV